MKKRIVLVILTLAAIVAVFAACSKDPIEQLQKQCDSIVNAKTVSQRVEISNGAFTQYKSERTYTKQGDSYSVTGTVTRTNGLDSDNRYTEEAVNQTVSANSAFSAKLHLNAGYFEEGYALDENGLTAKVLNDHVKDVLTLTDAEITAPTQGMSLKLTVADGNLVSIAINYTSNGSDVSITITIVY